MKKAEIEVTVVQRGEHHWPSAPLHRSYLRSPHVHDFRFTVWAHVDHDDREIEFHDLQGSLGDVVFSMAEGLNGNIAQYGTRSCEQLAREVIDEMASVYKARVSEDDGSSAIVTSAPMWERPPIVTLCGSTKFKDEFREAEAGFEGAGIAVFTVGFFAHADDVAITDKAKADADRLHKQKIALSDFIYVVNPGGYIGASTRSEIEFARANDIPIRYLVTPEEGGE